MARVREAFPRWGRLGLLLLMASLTLTGCMRRRADLDISTKEIDLGGGGTSASFVVRNEAKDLLITSGVTPLEYQIRPDKEWLSVTPLSGRLGEGEAKTHAVEIDRAQLVPGPNEGLILIESNGGDVAITVRAEAGGTACTTPPAAPAGPAPGAGATGVPVNAELAWSGGDSRCPGLTATYDVRFGTSSPPPLARDNGTSKSWDPPGPLANATTYYWQVVAKDANGSTAGPVWSFTTAAAPPTCTAGPTAPAGATPANGATSVAIDQNLSWTGGTSQCPGLTATYDIRFGTTPSPPLVRDNGTSKTWDPGTLANGTTYYWQIIAKDANGSTAGPVWSFTTVAAPPACTTPPAAPTLGAPASGALLVPVDQNLSWTGGNSQCPGLTATYDVRFGTTSPPPFDHDNGTSKSWDPGTLANVTTYYWQIVAKDANGQTAGPIWSFTTAPAEPCVLPPTVACTPNPESGRTNVNENANLAWLCGDSQCGLAVTYEVYFGTNPLPGAGELLGTTAVKSWNLPPLAASTTYYWRVVTKDANGTTPGPIWSFRTRD